VVIVADDSPQGVKFGFHPLNYRGCLLHDPFPLSFTVC
jgi:hypothetical protein